jgi:4-hydroxybenzoate polyprenyltransferase
MKAWLELMRAALGPTVVWDFMVGILLANVVWHNGLWWALASLLLIYFAGMILNDWRDLALDTEVNRKRPLVDGRIRPTTALVVATLMFGAAYVCAWRSGPYLAEFSVWLIAIVVTYDLVGAQLRKHLGPALLGSARAFSLCFGVVATYEANNVVAFIGIAAPLCYALYFLFLSRLAQREEHGIGGLNGISFLFMAAISPALLAQFERPGWVFYLAWLAIAALLLAPAWPRRHEHWSPQWVQLMVRRALSMAPLIPGLALLTSSDGHTRSMAPIAILICLLVHRLVRRYST